MDGKKFSVKETSFRDIYLDSYSLLVEHREELTTNKKLMELNPDEDRYDKAEEDGVLLTLAAYEGDRLIGYSLTFIGSHLHYANFILANNDVIFVTKEFRKTKVGLQLIKETERLSKERGAAMVFWHAKENTALAALLPRMGCSVQDIIYSKEL